MTTGPEEILQAAARFLDEEGYYRPEDADPIRAAVRTLLGANTPPDHPRQVFGSWESLPKPAQGALRRLAEEEISGVMSLRPTGRFWPGLARLLFSFGLALQARRRFLRVAGWAETGSLRITTALPKLRERLDRRLHRVGWKKASRVSATHLLAALGRTPRWLLGDFATEVRVDPRARGFFHDRGRNVIWAYGVGVDLIPTHDGVWCVEANLNTGTFYDEGDEIWELYDPARAIERIAQRTKELGLETLWWEHKDWNALEPRLLRTIGEKAEAAGLNLIVRQDFRLRIAKGLPESLPRPLFRLVSPTDVPENTLVFRRNTFSVGSDRVVSDKEPFTRGVDAELRRAGDRRCRIPAMSRMPGSLSPLSDDGMPNLVYKYPGLWGGLGVHFMRVSTADQALDIAGRLDRDVGNNPPGLFQPFVCSRLLPGRRVYDVRCELLISPLGATFISAEKRESSQSIPEDLGEGLVSARGVFTSNTTSGGTYSWVDLAEGDEVREAALAVGEALVRLLSRGFVTSA
ncbi:hypothetical protein ACFL3S_01220 [Gemmatimonadota bacterium]